MVSTLPAVCTGSDNQPAKGSMHCVYLLGCTGWQELDSVSLVSRDVTRQEDGVLLGIIGHEGDQALHLLYCESMFGSPLAVAMK